MLWPHRPASLTWQEGVGTQTHICLDRKGERALNCSAAVCLARGSVVDDRAGEIHMSVAVNMSNETRDNLYFDNI